MEHKALITKMHCSHCETSVKIKLTECKDISRVNLSYKTGVLTYESPQDQFQKIQKILEDTEYGVKTYKKSKFKGPVLFLLMALTFLFMASRLYQKFSIPDFSQSFTLLGVVFFGFTTSFHCVGMCGGIALSQTQLTDKRKNIMNSLLYNTGRILTYTTIGFILGNISSVFSVSNDLKNSLYFVIGTVMLLIGLNNLGLIQFRLFKLNFSTKPYLKDKGAFLVGILNGFMPCGPLQTMYILALSTGNPLQSALIMFIFGLGTLPILFAFANIGLLIKNTYRQYLLKASALLVIVMAVMIFSQGMGSLNAFAGDSNSDYAPLVDGHQIVNIQVNPGYTIDEVKVKKDIPVKLVFDVKSVSGCTANIMVPKYDVNTDLSPGKPAELVFTPTVAENLRITCWMSMVNTYLEVE